jgi:TonB family protein
MQEVQKQAKDTPGICDRRQTPRRKLMPMAYIELGQDNGGILLNISEGGLAIQSAMVLTSQDLPDARFQLPGSTEWITADARIVRLSESKKEAGVELIRISDDAKARIREWVADDEPRPQVVGRKADDIAALPAFPEVAQNTEEPRSVSIAPGTLFGNANSWGTLAPAPAASTWVDREIFGFPAVAASEENTGWLRFALTAVLLAAVSFFVGANLGPTYVHRWVVSTIQQLTWTKATPAAPEGSRAANASVGPAISTPTPPSVTAAPAETRVEDRQTPDQAAPVHETVRPPTQAAAAGELAHSPVPKPESNRVFKVAAGANAQKEASSRAAVQKPNEVARVSASRSDNGISSLTEHSILVTAPGAGSPDFYVNLPEEAISASPAIAITAHRSVRITPRYVYPQAERVRIGQLVARGEPSYPPEALNEKVEGTVQLHAILGPYGDVTNVRAVSGGPPALESAAIAAVRTWRYEPTLIDGHPVATEADITVTFRLP